MKLTAQVKLSTESGQHSILLKTLEEANSCCDWISGEAFREKVFSRFSLQKIVYRRAREVCGLSSQITIRAIAKVCDAYSVNKETRVKFKKFGAFPYDNKNLSWKTDKKIVSISTINGRLKIPYLCGRRAEQLLQGKRGEADLCFIRGEFYLFVSCEVETPDPVDIDGALGVDLGLNNIAVDSDGNFYSGSHIVSIQKRRDRQRARLQSKGTESAKRVLKRLSGRETRFVKDVNHQISKQLVERAQRTGRAIALEDLSGIRKRVRASRSQRRRLHAWTFSDLRQKIEYKARLAGIPLMLVNPAYTSQTCSCCGHVSPDNRKSQDTFICVKCGFSAHADHNAAINIAGLFANQPHVGSQVPLA
ncbi:transposase [Candidatus Kaiserbacteria bacterium]|nr:transposase [Candidatus Kaiserbacteria bacterium]